MERDQAIPPLLCILGGTTASAFAAVVGPEQRPKNNGCKRTAGPRSRPALD